MELRVGVTTLGRTTCSIGSVWVDDGNSGGSTYGPQAVGENVLAVDATPRPVHDSPVLLNQGGKGARCTGFDRAELSLQFMLRDSTLFIFFQLAILFG